MEELICSHESALTTYTKIRTKLKGRRALSSCVRRIAKTRSSAENVQALSRGYCHSLDVTTLFSKVIFNKLRINVKNEMALMFAKFDADLINISKTKWSHFLAYPVQSNDTMMPILLHQSSVKYYNMMFWLFLPPVR